MLKVKKMSYTGLLDALSDSSISAKKLAKVNKRLEVIDAGKRTDVPINKSGRGDWGGPYGCSVSTIQDVLNALNTIEDKSLIFTWEGITADGEFKDWGDISKITIIEVNEDTVANGRSLYTCNQVVLEISSNV